ncbi:hypothetical protein ACFPK5_39965 [Streptomyces beijiangensis]
MPTTPLAATHRPAGHTPPRFRRFCPLPPIQFRGSTGKDQPLDAAARRGPLLTGMIGCHLGAALAATDALRVRMFGRAAHGSHPETAIDPGPVQRQRLPMTIDRAA